MRKLIALILVCAFSVLLFSPQSVVLSAELQTFTQEAEEDIVSSYKDNVDISNEVFYGQYDEDSGRWIEPGYFNYEAYPEMSLVQEAAKKGDYELAKKETLNYYRNAYEGIFNTSGIDATTATKRDILSAYLLENNLVMHNYYTLLDVVDFGKEYSEVKIDLTQDITALLGTDKSFTLYIMGVKKDGSSLTITSNNSSDEEHWPKLSIMQKGVRTSYTPSDDATISPGSNRSKKYGLEPELMVEESVSSIHSDIYTDSNTKRTLMKFNLSKVDENAPVTNATLTLHGKNIGSTDRGEIAIFKAPSIVWTESEVSFYSGGSASIEHLLFSHYGLPYFDYNVSNHNGYATDGGIKFAGQRYAEDLLRCFNLTVLGTLYLNDTDRYNGAAHTALRHWIGFLNLHGSKEKYYNTALDGHVRERNMSNLLKNIIGSEYMTPDIWSASLKYMWINMNWSITNASSYNGRDYQLKCIVQQLAHYREFRLYDDLVAAAQKWTDDLIMGALGNKGLMYEDGSSVEGAMGYAREAMIGPWAYDIPLKDASITDTILTPEQDQKLHQGFRWLMDLAMPGIRDPQWGDSYRYTGNYLKSSLANAGRRYSDPELLWLGTDGVEGTKPDAKAVRYPVGSYYVMRTGWDDSSDLYLSTRVRGEYESHNHADDNSIVAYAYGQYLLTDQLYYSYSSSLENYLHTKFHNTVEFDNNTQEIWYKDTDRHGEEERFADGDLYDNFTLASYRYGTTDTGNTLVHVRNTLFIKPNYWIVNDYLVPKDQSKSHNYKQRWYTIPGAGIDLNQDTMTGRSHMEGANIIVAQASRDGITASVQNSFMGGGGEQRWESQHWLYDKTESGNAVFNTVLYPEKPDENVNVESNELPLEDVTENGVVAMNIIIDNKTTGEYANADYYLVHDVTQQKSRVFGSYSTDGRSAYAEKDKDGRTVRLIAQDASVLTDTERNILLFRSALPVTEFASEASDYQLRIDASEDLDIENFTVYCETAREVTEVYINGVKRTDFKLAGKYIYFGDAPLENGGKWEAEQEQKPSGGGSHGSGPSIAGGGFGDGTLHEVIDKPPITEPEKPVETKSYADVEADRWSAQYITKLSELGIFSGFEDGTFRPENNIARDEFLKVLLESFRIPITEEGDIAFNDVTQGAWNEKYIKTGVKTGIINGISPQEFGVNMVVSRQDMAVMIGRALEYLGETFGGEKVAVTFKDGAEIDEYATESVALLAAHGIINGNENGEFMPKQSATREQVAKIICNMIEKKTVPYVN